MTSSAFETGDTDLASLAGLLARQKAAATRVMNPDSAARNERLLKLDAMVQKHADQFCELVSQDFGHRPVMVGQIGDVLAVRSAVRFAHKHLKRWMADRRVGTSVAFMPGSCRVISQPLGVVGIIGAWNYPLQLTLSPLVGALAAGNRAMLKPSELTPLFAEALKQAIAATFAEDEVCVVTGGPAVGQAFAALPFDHLIFTGSTRTGRLVAEAAAKNLTPVTLELGGKSPVIVDASADLAMTADRVAFGKLFNAGQTCIAPDYALVPRPMLEPFVASLQKAVTKQYPTIAANPDYTSIINDTHFARVTGLVDDAKAQGARAIEIGSAVGGNARTIVPTLLLNVTDDMAVMQEEIFGPVLPILTYDRIEDAIGFVAARPRPLSLYWFGTEDAARDKVLNETIAGGVSINETMMHVVQEGLPFGGVGPSGMGHYHGEYGFRQLSKEKPVFYQSRRMSSAGMLNPPYTAFTKRLVKMLARWA